MVKKKIKCRAKLTHEEKCQIYNLKKSGKYYDSEICEMFNITRPTIWKIVKAFDKFLESGVLDERIIL